MRISVALGLAAIILVAGVSGWASSHSEVEQALTAYLDASLHDRDEEAYSYLSERYRAAMSLDDYSAEKENQIVINCNDVTRRTTFEVKDTDIDGDRAVAEVKITEPDVKLMMKDLIGAFVAWVLDDEDELEEIKQEMEDTYSEGDIPMTTRIEYYDMVKENGAWKVDLEP
jgi:hypothetical protein